MKAIDFGCLSIVEWPDLSLHRDYDHPAGYLVGKMNVNIGREMKESAWARMGILWDMLGQQEDSDVEFDAQWGEGGMAIPQQAQNFVSQAIRRDLAIPDLPPVQGPFFAGISNR